MLQKSRGASERALQINPALAEAHAALAKMKHWSGDIKGAESGFEKAIDLNPNYAPSYQWYGQMLGSRHNRLDEALQLSIKSVELDPKSAIILCDYAGVLERAGMFREAIEYNEMAIKLEPELTKAYRQLGIIKATANGRLDEAIFDFKTALLIEPDSWRTISELGYFYLNLGDIEKARHWLEELKGVDNKGEMAWLSAQINLLERNENHAVVDIQSYLVERRSGKFEARMMLGHLLMKMGDPPAAHALYALLDEKLPASHFWFNRRNVFGVVELAYILLESEHEARAKELLTESLAFIEQYPRLGVLGSNILEVKIHALLGDEDRALEALRELVDSGWRINAWYYFEHDPSLHSLRSHPTFMEIKKGIEADLTEQRKRVDARDGNLMRVSLNYQQ